MSSLDVVRVDPRAPSGIIGRLFLWLDSLLPSDRIIAEGLLGHSLALLSFQVPPGFVDGILSCWIPDRQVFRFRLEYLTPTLEEYARFTGLSVDGPCARVTSGHMRRQFLTFTGLRRTALLSVTSSSHLVPLSFLVDRFGSVDSFSRFFSDFSVSEERWGALRVDVLMACVVSVLYMPAGDDLMDMRVIVAVQALQEDHTILPMILAETYLSASYCHSFSGRIFRGSSILLYVWFMSHLRPIGQFRRHGFCFSHSLAMQFSFRPRRCTDTASWREFLSAIEEPFHLLIYSGYCSFQSFLTHVPPFDFLPLLGLRGVTTYHPLAVMGQFDQMQDLHLFTGAADYRFLISPQTERELLRVYDLWSHRISADFGDSHPGQTPDYLLWLQRDSEIADFDPIGVLGGSRGLFPDETSSDAVIPTELSGLAPMSGVEEVSASVHVTSFDLADRIQGLLIEGTRLRSALRATEIERDTAHAERDAAVLACDAALSARDSVIEQVRVVMEGHSATVTSAAALLTRVDMMGQQIAGEPEVYDASTTLSILLQLVSDL